MLVTLCQTTNKQTKQQINKRQTKENVIIDYTKQDKTSQVTFIKNYKEKVQRKMNNFDSGKKAKVRNCKGP